MSSSDFCGKACRRSWKYRATLPLQNNSLAYDFSSELSTIGKVQNAHQRMTFCSPFGFGEIAATLSNEFRVPPRMTAS
jgi:hypothetical protein